MTSMITARVDTEKRKTAEKVFSEVGLTTSAAVNLFICAVAMSGGIPFKIGLSKSNGLGNPVRTAKRGGINLGIADGKYKFDEDFDRKFDDMDAEVAKLFE